MTIASNQRIGVFGMTQSGKTTMVKKVILPIYKQNDIRYVFHDMKRMNKDVPHDVIVHNPKQLRQVINTRKQILYQPDSIKGDDWNAVCEIVHEKGNMVLVADEIYLIASRKIEDGHKTILTQGAGRGIGMVNTSQRAKWLEETIFSESEHYFIFRLGHPGDANKIMDIIGFDFINADTGEEVELDSDMLTREMPYYHFLYIDRTTGTCRWNFPIGWDEKSGSIPGVTIPGATIPGLNIENVQSPEILAKEKEKQEDPLGLREDFEKIDKMLE